MKKVKELTTLLKVSCIFDQRCSLVLAASVYK